MDTQHADARPTVPTHISAIDRFLEAVAAGTTPPGAIYAESARVDATTPGWRAIACGPPAIVAHYGGWFRDPGTFAALRRLPTATGEVVVYYLTWAEGDVAFAAHHCHVIDLDANGRIVADQVFCGGRWGPETLAEIELAR